MPRCDVIESNSRTRRSVLLAKVGLDGHDRGIRVIARVLRDAGYEVVYAGLRQTPESIANAALEEDVAVVGVSMHNGGHLTLAPRVVQALRRLGLDTPVVIGGVIPDGDIRVLKAAGIAEVFTPGSAVDALVDTIERLSRPQTDEASASSRELVPPCPDVDDIFVGPNSETNASDVAACERWLMARLERQAELALPMAERQRVKALLDHVEIGNEAFVQRADLLDTATNLILDAVNRDLDGNGPEAAILGGRLTIPAAWHACYEVMITAGQPTYLIYMLHHLFSGKALTGTYEQPEEFVARFEEPGNGRSPRDMRDDQH